MKHSIKFAVIYLCGHVCMQSHTQRTENSIRFAYISVRADGKKHQVLIPMLYRWNKNSTKYTSSKFCIPYSTKFTGQRLPTCPRFIAF